MILLVLTGTSPVFAQLDFGPISKSDTDPPNVLPEVLKPINARSEADEDQLTAATHFAQGKLLQGKGKTSLALRHLQRAWRYDESANFLLADIVPLAFDAKQNDAATRYAVLAAEHNPRDPLLIRRLAIYLTEKRDFKRAARMYEKSLAKDSQLVNGMPEDVGAATVYAELGRLYFLNDEYKKAAGTFSIVRKGIEHPDSPLDEMAKKSVVGEAGITYALWGESFYEAGKLDDAIAMFRKANEAKADAPLLAFRVARVEVAQQKFAEARQHLDEYFAAKADTSGGAPYTLLGKLIVQQAASPAVGQEQLITKLRELHQEQADNIPLAFALADALWTAGKLDEAVPLLTKSLARQPDSERYAKLIEHHWQQKEYCELLAAAGQLAERSGSLESIEDLTKRMERDEGLIKGCVVLAREAAAQTDPKPNHGPILAAAVLARDAGELKNASELFQAVLALSPANATELRVQWALGLFFADHHVAAAEMFRQVLDQKPKNPSAIRYYLAGALAMAGKTDEALQEIRIALEANAGSPRYESRLAWVLYHGKRLPEAAAEYEKILKKHGDKQQPETRQILRSARLALSNIALEQDDFPAAVEWLEQVLDEYPEDPGALNDLGYLWADRGVHLQRALRMTQKAVELEPKSQAYRDSLGWAYYRLGRYDEAVRELISATTDNVDASDGVLLDHLGDALAKQGKRGDATKAWQRAAEAFQKAGEVKKMKTAQDKLNAP
jgi:tetratricopeptide (TPR) repeat protein